MEKHSVARLIGAPPGYVGYDEGGALTEAVRRRPYQVVLFDEIEKAHPDVFNVLLQVLDDGRLTDGQGRTVDFRNTLIVMTSNLGSEYLVNQPEGQDTEAVRDQVMGEVRAAFRPEFLNRVDEIILFHRLKRENMGSIVDIQMKRLTKLLEDRKIALQLDAKARDWLAEKGYDPAYGARPLKRAIQKAVQDPLAELILSGKIKDGEKVEISAGRRVSPSTARSPSRRRNRGHRNGHPSPVSGRVAAWRRSRARAGWGLPCVTAKRSPPGRSLSLASALPWRGEMALPMRRLLRVQSSRFESHAEVSHELRQFGSAAGRAHRHARASALDRVLARDPVPSCSVPCWRLGASSGMGDVMVWHAVAFGVLFVRVVRARLVHPLDHRDRGDRPPHHLQARLHQPAHRGDEHGQGRVGGRRPVDPRPDARLRYGPRDRHWRRAGDGATGQRAIVERGIEHLHRIASPLALRNAITAK